MMNQRPFFLFVHVPKTGGESFRRALVRCLGHRCVFDYGMFDNVRYPADQVGIAINQRPDHDCLCAHHLTFDLPYDLPGRPFVAFTLLRDPVARVLSWFFAVRNHTKLAPRFREMTVSDFVREEVRQGSHWFLANGQLRHLMGEVSEQSLRRFEEIIRRDNVLAIPLTKIALAACLLEHRFPDQFSDLSSRHTNISKKDSALDPEAEALLRELVSFDLKALALAEAIFAEKVEVARKAEGFNPEAALEDFQRRAAARNVAANSGLTRLRKLMARALSSAAHRIDVDY
ncbi:MAG: sulfotransferase family 2 domain-containing protein [Opitutales bacterium]|nr:sulfotransferase family 2 domain-containing protein [Opitutales bacterium]